MTIKEYLQQNSKTRSGKLVIGPIAEESDYCVQCFQDEDEVNKVTYDATRKGWVCGKGHFGQGDTLVAGGTVRGPNW